MKLHNNLSTKVTQNIVFRRIEPDSHNIVAIAAVVVIMMMMTMTMKHFNSASSNVQKNQSMVFTNPTGNDQVITEISQHKNSKTDNGEKAV